MSRRSLPRIAREHLLATASRLGAPLIMVRAEAPPVPDIKALTAELTRITAEFKAKGDDLTKKAEEAMKEVKDKGALLAATKAEVDKLLLEHTTLAGEKNKLQTQVAELTGRIVAAEQLIVQRPGPGNTQAGKSVGQQLIESDDFKKFAAGSNGFARGKHRFSVKAAVTSLDFPVTQPSIVGPMVAPPLPLLQQRLFVRDLLPVGQTSNPAIWWIRQTGFTNNAAVVTEGALKPTSTIAYDSVMTAVSTIAHLFKASKQILADFAQLRTDVDRELRYGLKYVEEQELLLGDGTGIHLHGIVPQATAFSAAFSPALHNRIDDIRLAMLQATLARLPPSGIVMHYTDWAQIELTKDSTGQYLMANPLRLAGMTLWGLPVVPTEIASFEDNFLVGPFNSGAQIYDREEINVEISTENNDDFEKNMVTIRCEERVALAVFRPEGFIYGGFTNPT